MNRITGDFAKSIVLVGLLLCTAVVGQPLDEKEVIPSTDSETSSDTGGDESECNCTPFNLCKSYVAKEDGNNLIDIRVNMAPPCLSYMDVCCNDHKNPDTDEKHDKNPITDEKHDKNQNTDEKHETYPNTDEKHDKNPITDEKHDKNQNTDEKHEKYPNTDEKHDKNQNTDEKHEKYPNTDENHETTSDKGEHDKNKNKLHCSCDNLVKTDSGDDKKKPDNKEHENKPDDNVHESKPDDKEHESKPYDKEHESKPDDKEHENKPDDNVHESKPDDKEHESKPYDKEHGSKPDDKEHEAQPYDKKPDDKEHESKPDNKTGEQPYDKQEEKPYNKPEENLSTESNVEEEPSLTTTVDEHKGSDKHDDEEPKCGQWNKDGVGFRIVNAVDGESQYGEYPSMVAIFVENNPNDPKEKHTVHCGGSLIKKNIVLTAAHCVIKKNIKNLVVRAGEWDLETEKEIYSHQDRRVSKMVTHPDYYAGGLHSDVALLYTDEPFYIQDNVHTICLPEQSEIFDYDRCFSCGWGKTVSFNNYTIYKKNHLGSTHEVGKYQVSILKKVEVPVVPREKCMTALRGTRLGPKFVLHDSFMCAGGEEGKDTCRGDGGGPLMCPSKNDQNSLVQAGIVSWGIQCGLLDIPAVYVDVANFRNWIDKEIETNKLSYSKETY